MGRSKKGRECRKKMTEEAAKVGAGPEWEGQRKEESEES